MTSPQTSYDCYQINIQVNLSEEDSCLYKRYGTSMFSIKNVSCSIDETKICCSDQIINPDASILNIELDKCDHIGALFSIYVKLPYNDEQKKFENQTFCISSGSSGTETNILTFEVASLSVTIVSTGVINKCHVYEIMRVPNRTIDISSTNCSSLNTTIADGCTEPGTSTENLFFVADTLNITFPLTKDLKSFYLNNCSSEYVLVRAVSCGASKFCIPARLYFDIDKCTVRLNISVDFIITMFNDPTNTNTGYYHMFNYSCNDQHNIINTLISSYNEITNDSTTSTTSTSVTPNYALYATLGKLLFEYIAGKKINISGVNKCSETVLYNFTICYFPYIGYTINKCGTSILTIAETISTNYGTTVIDFQPENSFKVETCRNYSYQFIFDNPFTVPDSQTGPVRLSSGAGSIGLF